jgi:uncharacterized membrane protein
VALAKARTTVRLAPAEALALWTDLRRWPSFMEGFARVKRAKGDWPEPGALITWESIPGGRGMVTEKVLSREEAQIETEIFEDAFAGRQTARFVATEGGATRAELELEYKLTRSGLLRQVTDVLFIRRALNDSLTRTLRRFAVEAEEEAALR